MTVGRIFVGLVLLCRGRGIVWGVRPRGGIRGGGGDFRTHLVLLRSGVLCFIAWMRWCYAHDALLDVEISYLGAG